MIVFHRQEEFLLTGQNCQSPSCQFVLKIGCWIQDRSMNGEEPWWYSYWLAKLNNGIVLYTCQLSPRVHEIGYWLPVAFQQDWVCDAKKKKKKKKTKKHLMF
jgi:hypothetical protein